MAVNRDSQLVSTQTRFMDGSALNGLSITSPLSKDQGSLQMKKLKDCESQIVGYHSQTCSGHNRIVGYID